METPSWPLDSPSRPTYQNWSVGKAEWVWSTKYCYGRVEIRTETNIRVSYRILGWGGIKCVRKHVTCALMTFWKFNCILT